MKALAVLAVALLCGTAHAATLSWTNPMWEDYADTSIKIRTQLDSLYVLSSQWDVCGAGCGGEMVIATLSGRGREGMPERLVIARPPGVFSYRVRTTDLSHNRSWASNEVVYDERPASLARTALREPEMLLAPRPTVKAKRPWWRPW